MNWDAVGAIGEIIGAGAVVISLMYLAVQIRIQNRESKNATIIQLTEQWNALLTFTSQSDEQAKVWVDGLKGEVLSDVEKVRFYAIASSFMHISESLYLQHLDGRLDVRVWRGLEGRLNDVAATKGMRLFWEARKNWFSVEFGQYVESKISSSNLESDLYSAGSARE